MIKKLGVRRANSAWMLFSDTSRPPCHMNYRAHYTSAHPKPVLPFLAVLIGLTISLAAANQARAIGGPENVLLVVNPLSPNSLCIANHYAELRHIPPSNFLFLKWDPHEENTDAATFREKILLPVLQVAQLHIPGRQIDYVVYSSDFPWGINVDSDLKVFKAAASRGLAEKGEKAAASWARWFSTCTPLASINGLTYLWELELGNKSYFMPMSNSYARTGAPEPTKEPSMGFSSTVAFRSPGETGADRGHHYLLSMMLAVTAGRGSTLEEVLSYLKRSAAADGTHPQGTVYFVQNGDIRSKVRQSGFPDAVRKLKALGVAAEILHGDVPEGKNDVQGAMLGVASFDWKAARSTILPGAICEHFTSFGGDMHGNASQTPLSEWLRYGAAATSGTVTEPYSIPNKFPSPMMQVHYACGCTVAEAYYQSLLCPYQLLIVGDPLCRPWANIPEITVEGVTAGETVHGEIKLKPKARFALGAEAERFEMVLDGLTVRECPPEGSLEVDTAMIADGAHELRVVAVSKGPVPARGEKILSFSSTNHNRTIHVTCEPAKVVSLKKSLIITARSPKSTSIRIVRGTSLLKTIFGDDGQVEIPAQTLGRGPVRIQIVGMGDEGPQSNVFAPPLEILVEE
ncbi:MAG: TIGR03790 family protein [Thermoguttaceae bacterium]